MTPEEHRARVDTARRAYESTRWWRPRAQRRAVLEYKRVLLLAAYDELDRLLAP